MPFDADGPLSRLVTIAAGIPGVQSATAGAPEAPETATSVQVTLGGFELEDWKNGGIARRFQNYYVTVGYRVEGAEPTAELTLAQIVDGLIVALLNDRNLGGTVESHVIQGQAADVADYAILAGQEYRVYPLVVRAKQQQQFTVPQP